jgi:multicomponent Na+:H+ antiporter subunit G
MQDALCALLMVTGAMFMFIAGVGLLRMPDLFIRMSATTKASTLGVGFLLLAVAVKFTYLEMFSRIIAIIVFVVLTAPVAVHMIARAAYIEGVPLWRESIVDQLCDRYDRCMLNLKDHSAEGPEDEEKKRED